MPWTTPTLKQVRTMVRDDVTASLSGVVIIGNSVLRVICDAMAGLGHLTLRYIDWLSNQFLPDSCEDEWLDRHGDIWLVNADSSVGRKGPTFAEGSVTMTGLNGSIIPTGTTMQFSALGIVYEVTEQATLGTGATAVEIRADDPGAAGNLDAGEVLSLVDPISGVDSDCTVVELTGGADEESDNELRARVLARIRQPPCGGNAKDYVAWATSVTGVTRAWASNEMGPGCVTVRFMMDDIRSAQNGLPTEDDVELVETYINSVRPVSVKDCWVLAPVPEPIDLMITDLDEDTESVRAGIEDAIKDMLRRKAAPAYMLGGVRQSAQTIYAAWVSEAVSSVAGVNSFTLTMADHEMPNNGNIGVLGTILYEPS